MDLEKNGRQHNAVMTMFKEVRSALDNKECVSCVCVLCVVYVSVLCV